MMMIIIYNLWLSIKWTPSVIAVLYVCSTNKLKHFEKKKLNLFQKILHNFSKQTVALSKKSFHSAAPEIKKKRKRIKCIFYKIYFVGTWIISFFSSSDLSSSEGERWRDFTQLNEFPFSTPQMEKSFPIERGKNQALNETEKVSC